MAVLSESPREDGQTSFPSLGEIMEAMEEAREVWPRFSEGRTEVLTLPIYARSEVKRLNS